MSLKVNKRVKDVEGSSTLAITARANELKSQGHDVVNFGAGEPDFDTPEPIKQAAIKAIQEGFTKYTPSIGTVKLREAISQKFKKENYLDYSVKQIAVSCGAKHTIFNIIQVLADDGDEVLIPAPYWVSYPEMVKMAGAVSKFIPTTAKNNLKITAKQLEASITSKTKILILNSPSNPTGMVYNKKELEAIADICVKHKIYVISDEIYEKLIYESNQYCSFASLGKEVYDLTITVNGMSKSYAMTGWRIGYCGASEEIIGFINRYQDHSTSNPTSISQMAALAALQQPEDAIIFMRNEFKKRRDIMMAAIDKMPGISYVKPEGAFYLFADFSKYGVSFDLAKRILNDVNVAIIPGEGFGAPGFMRFSFATSAERIQEGMKRISEWLSHNKIK
ncbi:MAG TPA: pyridoxal phosphate-dependent aminotransferase [Candidatus Omnitrophota bacterium]|nr:pyridoxal phosphate-dependent aminotransferase [Candidatus Omnitrophota bacterium]